MTEDARHPATHPTGAGVLLHTEVERVALGTHGDRRLTARVEHRTLRLALGRLWHASLTLGRRRAVAIEVERAGTEVERDRETSHASSTPSARVPRYDEVAIPAPVQPWARFARRVVAVALAGWLLNSAVTRARRRAGRAARQRTTGETP
ncbi:MAG: hypothetical protein M0R73_08695 [Dehalococcoidia bacterium]|nr:hypothetical protein [Dehalococcoidia bacterium]